MNIVVDAENIPQMPAGTKYNHGVAYSLAASILFSLGWKSTKLACN